MNIKRFESISNMVIYESILSNFKYRISRIKELETKLENSYIEGKYYDKYITKDELDELNKLIELSSNNIKEIRKKVIEYKKRADNDSEYWKKLDNYNL
jgi:hypothetical protein